MHPFRVLAVVGIIAIAASCGGSSSPTGGGGGGGGGGACSGTSASPAVCDNFFSPATITATNGSSLTFTWKGHGSHNVTFISGPTSPPASSTMTSGSFTTAPLSTGTYTIECTIHGFEATINVN